MGIQNTLFQALVTMYVSVVSQKCRWQYRIIVPELDWPGTSLGPFVVLIRGSNLTKPL